jgi:hypothetical protein
MTTEELNKQYIAGLLEERRQHVAAGRDERVELVDAELRRVGHKADKPAKRAERRPRQQVEHRTATATPETPPASLTSD